MRSLLWTGKISLASRLILDAASILGWFTGRARDVKAMKARVRGGYEGWYSDHVFQYGQFGGKHYSAIGNRLLRHVDCNGKEVADIGCGLGVITLAALEERPRNIVCTDSSHNMLSRCKKNVATSTKPYADVTFCESDVENLPFADNSFDVVLCSMVIGMLPNQQKAIAEMTRVLRPQGQLGLATHGPQHYREAIEASLKAIPLRYFLDHRLEFWPRNQREIMAMLKQAGLDRNNVNRWTWTDDFEDGGAAFDFFAATSSLWWYEKLRPESRSRLSDQHRQYFQNHRVTRMTSDVIFAYGTKPSGA
jgi:ubiquinone/menaquinone biosynthesis C-methylase UbiE